MLILDANILMREVLGNVVRVVGIEVYAEFEPIACQRLARRDEDDWPILAAALALKCPIWTEETSVS